ncbi:hypothetical protein METBISCDRAFT_12140 [Metschnikowia bicuspidata]|uniref:Uncharacterized protein n=1 Tax=Metschnikowia bicuspidata TaxID=27322 RepID=A0A4P9ZHA0_9ASCO|nr:hypothetical protein METBISCDRAFT_12140 [Metschnikowia bicuspidata]
MSVVSEFGDKLRELATLKAPGVSGTRIKKLTSLAVQNVADEASIIAELDVCCRAMPSSHRLGALYVVDSIVRIYTDEAKKRNQSVSSLAPEGTFASGVHRISLLVEGLIDNALELLITPATNQKISKLVDIWERAQTFSAECIANMRNKHFRLLTPPGSPPGSARVDISPKPDTGSILLALASLAQKNDAPSAPLGDLTLALVLASPSQTNPTSILSQLSALAGKPLPTPPAPSADLQGANKDNIFDMLSQMQSGGATPAPNAGSRHLSFPLGPGQAQNYNQGPGDKYAQPPGFSPPSGFAPQTGFPAQNGFPVQNGFPDQNGFPAQNGYAQNYGQQLGYDRRGRENDYSRRTRSRSPTGRYDRHDDRRGQGPQPPGMFTQEGEHNVSGAPHYRPRSLGFDNTLPQGSFKVMSRTLFVGGLPRGMDEKALASHLRPYAEVQSVIMNTERKHAFVKVFSRKEAEAVIQSFNKDGALPLRTRWGVGFGPRDCCNYQHGISIIPIQRLTDADKQWVVQAQWGGTGGEPLVSGMVVDEPDIEIGTGISSKAMSKKMPTNSTRNGPKSNRPGESDELYAKTSAMGGQQEYMAYAQGANPLSGLFNNLPAPNPQSPAAAGYGPNYGNNALSPQLQTFFQNGPR